MNIHCSACGAPLPQGSKFCPACALPLTAIAMPTPPAPRKKPVPILTVLLGAAAILWVLMIFASRGDVSAAPRAAVVRASFGIDPFLERRIERVSWSSAARLHTWRSQVAENLTEAERRRSEPGAQQVIADDHAALSRIDLRLKELHAR